jgi:hypothetical protein
VTKIQVRREGDLARTTKIMLTTDDGVPLGELPPSTMVSFEASAENAFMGIVALKMHGRHFNLEPV